MLETLRTQHRDRSPLYAEVADLVVDIDEFHLSKDKPKRAIAQFIASQVPDRHARAADA